MITLSNEICIYNTVSLYYYQERCLKLKLSARDCWANSYETSSEYHTPPTLIYRAHINYQKISLCHNLSRKCRKIMKFMSITHSEHNIWNGPRVTTAL
jgi:hypothetical protein